MDRDTVVRLIRDGRAQDLSDEAVADQVVAFTEDPTWAKAMSHPMRGAIMRIMRRDGPISPARAAGELGGSLGTVSYHFRALCRLGLIEVFEQIPRRGAIEHVYQLTGA